MKTKFTDTFQMTHAKDSKDAKGYEKNPLEPLRPPREVESNSLFRRWHGPLTEELALQPGPSGLGKVPARLKPEVITRVVCGYCSTGCALDVHLKDGAAVNLSPTGDYPVNLGMACPKGWEALAPLNSPDRAATPLVRGADGALQPASWDEAMRLFTTKFKNLMALHGNESVAFLSTGQICTEEMALLGAVFKFGMGAIHCDSNTRQCMATAHVAYKQSFGFDAPPFTYADFEESDVLVFIGANPCIAHPIMWQRVLRNENQPKIIVIDPRRTETAMNATQHLALNPKSDLTLLYGVANLLAQNGWLAREFIERSTTGFDEFATFVRQFTPDKVAAETGLTVGEIYRLAEAIHLGKAVSFWWTMGVNQSHEATRTAQAIINLALMTGNIGRPGTGANSITGQCNAMGSRLFSNTTNLLGGHDFLNAAHRTKVANILGFEDLEEAPPPPPPVICSSYVSPCPAGCDECTDRQRSRLSPAQMFSSSPSGGGESMRLMYLLSITAARHAIRLSASYFVPDALTIRTLVQARERGVEVQVIVPGGYIDSETVRRASRGRRRDRLL
jgi:assimilatory nitrate reductase catalytic subunit